MPVFEQATLVLRVGTEEQFEAAFRDAIQHVEKAHGLRSHHLLRCIEEPHRYLLSIEWDQLEDHTIGFRQSQHCKEWQRQISHHFQPGTSILHFEPVR